MPVKSEPEWFAPVAELIARESITLKEAATRLQVPLTTEAASNTFRSKAFQRVLRAARNQHWREICRDQTFSKDAVVGQMYWLASQLAEAGELEKALDGLLKLSKVQGWLGAETNVNVFQGLSGRDIETLKKQTIERQKEESIN